MPSLSGLSCPGEAAHGGCLNSSLKSELITSTEVTDREESNKRSQWERGMEKQRGEQQAQPMRERDGKTERRRDEKRVLMEQSVTGETEWSVCDSL